MGDKDEKLARLLDTIGAGADPDFAREVLVANNWDLHASAIVILGEGAQLAPAPTRAPPAASSTAMTGMPEGGMPSGLGRMPSADVRAPMRTGFYETLLTTDPSEQARQDRAREEERLRLEAERVAAEDRKKREAEEARNKDLARRAEEQRAAAEQKAIERKKQKMLEEKAASKSKAARGRRDDDSDSDLEDIPIESGIMLAELSNQLAGKAPTEKPREEEVPVPAPPPEPIKEETSEQALKDAVVETPALPPAPQVETAEATPTQHKEEQPPEPPVMAAPEAEKAADPLVSALRTLRKQYKEEQPAALAACYRTLNDCIGHVIKDPQETKYQRIKSEKFRSRAGGLEGAVAALEACGFHPDDSNEFLVMDADYARTQGLRLRDAQRKVELLLDELASAGF